MKHPVLACLLLALPCAASAASATKRPPGYPTADRVLYVQQCMREHPGPSYEMTNKCSCVLDAIARQLPFDQYVQLSTAANANSIGGERGSYIRDTEMLQKQIKRFREVQAKAKKGCFIDPEAK